VSGSDKRVEREFRVLCRSCYSFTSPYCECGEVYSVSSDEDKKVLLIKTVDLNKIEIYKVWTSKDGEIIYKVPVGGLALARVKQVPFELEKLKEVLKL